MNWSFLQRVWWTFTGHAPEPITPMMIAEQEQELLAQDVLRRELQLIDDQYKLKAQKAKIQFIADMARRCDSSS